MGELASATRIVGLAAIMMAAIVVTPNAGYSQPASQSSGIESFFAKLPGDWVGTVSQSTDGKFADTKYFHAVVKQLSPDIFETVFTFYKLDKKTGAPVLAGLSGMETKIDTAGTATNILTGKGDLQVDAKTWKPETHEMTELLRTSPVGGLLGTGSGSITVGGRNGEVQGYSSTWLLNNDVLKISQRFKVKFQVFVFSKSFTITADYTAIRGSDLIGFIRTAQGSMPGS